VLIFDPATSGEITALELAAGPRWGAIADDILYAYHEQRQTLYDLQPTTMLSRLDLKSGEVETWPLPNGWGARDLAVMNGYIVLARPEQPGQDGEDGVYRFDPLTGEVRLLVDIVDASGFVAP
jgi:streptogramin lyase